MSAQDAGFLEAAPPPDRWPVRVWPGLLIVALVAAAMIVPGLLWPRTPAHFVSLFAAPLVGAVAAVGWWTFAARVRGPFRWLVPALLFVPAVVVGAVWYRGAEMAVAVYALPAVVTAWVLWLAVSWGAPGGVRRGGLVVAMLAVWAAVAMLRFDGADADLVPAFRWFWHPTEEERFAAERGERAKPAPGAPEAQSVVVGPGDWPGFRGPARDGRVVGVTIDTDWAARPPELVWKHRVGPGWGSFAVVGGRAFTQEQRGTDEAVVCYAADTGAELWEHRTPGRFTEVIAGAGPRATPTVHDGRLYAQGATGKLVCLDAATGTPHWTADLTADAGGVVPQWGYSGSPLVADDVVIVYAGGPTGKGTAAFKADTGALAWAAGNAKHGYSSAHPATLGGVPQVLMTSDYGVEAFRPADGKLLWEHAWTIKGMNRVTQPAVLGDSDVVFGTGVGAEQGTRRLRVTKAGDGWDVAVRWTSKVAKPYFNDGVVAGKHLYGFDDSRFCCLDLETGAEAWKEGNYGHGQVLLLADQGVLLVQAADGKVVLVEANPTEHNELGKFAALAGKTWNHPVVAGGRLYVRNGQEAACYRLGVK